MVASRKNAHRDLARALHQARVSRNLTQHQLATTIGLRQRQISDLERAAMDPRLSTLQNVSRALDLEVMLVPRQFIAAIESLQRTGAGAGGRPMYALGEDVDDGGMDDEAR
jgi:transcriptional regulator with XRE-family HTH domain